ncbi:MAG: hypothetical protein KAW12_03960 [Candidatus Aminicenantes bacterium]|nr:hypothetical protein [Candidatus Aminicenantes bacterium]
MAVTLEDIEELVKLQLGLRQVSPGDRFMEDLGAESADLMNIVATAEDRFKIVFDDAQIAGVRTVEELFNLIIKII